MNMYERYPQEIPRSSREFLEQTLENFQKQLQVGSQKGNFEKFKIKIMEDSYKDLHPTTVISWVT